MDRNRGRNGVQRPSTASAGRSSSQRLPGARTGTRRDGGIDPPPEKDQAALLLRNRKYQRRPNESESDRFARLSNIVMATTATDPEGTANPHSSLARPRRAASERDELVDRVAERAAIRAQLPPDMQHLFSDVRLKEALRYAPDEDDLTAAFSDDSVSTALARSKEEVARVVARSNMNDAYMRRGVNSALQRMSSVVPSLAGELGTDVQQRLEVIETEARMESAPQGDATTTSPTGALPQASGTEFVSQVTSVLGEQLERARMRSQETQRLLNDVATLGAPRTKEQRERQQRLEAQGAATRQREADASYFRKPSRSAATTTACIVPLESADHDVAVPVGCIALPADIFEVPDLISDGEASKSAGNDAEDGAEDAEKRTTEYAKMTTPQLVSHLRQLSMSRANRLADAYRRREARVKQLLHFVATLRTRVRTLELAHDDTEERVRRAFEAHGALTTAVEDTHDIASQVEEGMACMWGEIRRDFKAELASVINTAFKRASDLGRTNEQEGAATLTAATREVADLREQLRQATAVEVSASSRINVLEQESVEMRREFEHALEDLRYTRAQLAASRQSEVATNEELKRNEGVMKELEGRVAELSSSKKEEAVKLQYESLLTLRKRETDVLRQELTDLKAEALADKVQLIQIREQLDSSNALAMKSRAALVKHFIMLAQSTAATSAGLLDGLRDRNRGALRTAATDAVDSLATNTAAAIASTVDSMGSEADSSLSSEITRNMRDLLRDLKIEEGLIGVDPSAAELEALRERVTVLDAAASGHSDVIRRSAKAAESAALDAVAKERASATALVLQCCNAVRALLDARAEGRNQDLEGQSFPSLRPPPGLGQPVSLMKPGSLPGDEDEKTDVWAWRANDEALAYMKGLWHAVKRELVLFASSSREGKTAMNSAGPTSAVAQKTDSAGRVARRVCQALLRDLADDVAGGLSDPLLALLSEAAPQVGMEAECARQVTAQKKRRDATYKLGCHMIRRGFLAALAHTRTEAIQLAEQGMKNFVQRRRQELLAASNGGDNAVLCKSPDIEAALDRLASLQAAADRRHEKLHQRLAKLIAERDAELWTEFEQLNRVKLAALRDDAVGTAVAVLRSGRQLVAEHRKGTERLAELEEESQRRRDSGDRTATRTTTSVDASMQTTEPPSRGNRPHGGDAAATTPASPTQRTDQLTRNNSGREPVGDHGSKRGSPSAPSPTADRGGGRAAKAGSPTRALSPDALGEGLETSIGGSGVMRTANGSGTASSPTMRRKGSPTYKSPTNADGPQRQQPSGSSDFGRGTNDDQPDGDDVSRKTTPPPMNALANAVAVEAPPPEPLVSPGHARPKSTPTGGRLHRPAKLFAAIRDAQFGPEDHDAASSPAAPTPAGQRATTPQHGTSRGVLPSPQRTITDRIHLAGTPLSGSSSASRAPRPTSAAVVRFAAVDP